MSAVTYYSVQTATGRVTSILRLTITDTTLDLDRYSNGQWVSAPDRISSLNDMNVDQINGDQAQALMTVAGFSP